MYPSVDDTDACQRVIVIGVPWTVCVWELEIGVTGNAREKWPPGSVNAGFEGADGDDVRRPVRRTAAVAPTPITTRAATAATSHPARERGGTGGGGAPHGEAAAAGYPGYPGCPGYVAGVPGDPGGAPKPPGASEAVQG
jgi:hypothetical protein